MRRLFPLLSALALLSVVQSTFAYVHPIWGQTKTGQSAQEFRMGQQQLQEQQGVSTRASLQSSVTERRVCERILKRFSDDTAAIDRFNKRLKERFGYSCSVQGIVTRENTSPRMEARAELRLAPALFSPVGNYVPKGAMRVPVLRVVFSAACVSPVIVDSIVLTDTGPGLAADIPNVWMSIDGDRVSRSRALASNKTVQIRPRHGLVIPSCKSATVDFFVAVSQTALANDKHTFSINSSEDVSADVPVSGEFPIVGEKMGISSSKTGVLSLSYLPIDADPRIEGTDREILGRFKIELDSTEDQTLHAVTVRNTGSMRDGDVIGVYVRSSQGRARFTQIAPWLVNDQAYLPFDPPLPIEKGESLELDIVGNVASGTGATVAMGLDEAIDLYAVGSSFGYGGNGQLFGSWVQIIWGSVPKKMRIR